MELKCMPVRSVLAILVPLLPDEKPGPRSFSGEDAEVENDRRFESAKASRICTLLLNYPALSCLAL
jgi:hypothetical protein